MPQTLSSNSPKKKLVLTGGGTAGHVWPHFAVLEDPRSVLTPLVLSGQVDVFYFGSKDGIEKEIVRTGAPSWTYVELATGKLRRYFSWKNFTDPFLIVLGFIQAYQHLGRIGASCVFSKGGFVAAPVVWAAWLRRIPVVIHESDATPALATKLTLPFAERALTTFAQTVEWLPHRFKAKILNLGLPMRSSLFKAGRNEALKYFNLDPNRKTLLVFGGSLGASELNSRMALALPKLGTTLNIIHIVGKGKTFLADGGPFYRQYEFLKDEMSLVYAVADLSVCRAGASSIFELAAARIPMILVPLGIHQSRGDQIVNAKLFANRGWCQWVDESQLTGDSILQLVTDAMGELDQRKKALESAPTADAASKVAALLLSLMEKYVEKNRAS